MVKAAIPLTRSVARIQTIVAIFLQDRRLLVERRSRRKSVYPNYLMCPAGHVKEGESAVMTLQREMREELGIEVVNSRPLFSMNDIDLYSKKKFTHNFVLISSFNGTINRSSESAELNWMTYDQLSKEELLPLVRKLLRRLRIMNLM